MKLLSQILKKFKGGPKFSGKLYPEFKWRVAITNKHLYSTDWNGKDRTIDLRGIIRFYVKTNDDGPHVCDVWWGIETNTDQIEIPQGCKGEEALLEFANSLPGFQMKGMNSTVNATFDCWIKQGYYS